jgi:hypothetical protein
MAGYHVGNHIISELGYVPESADQFMDAVQDLKRQYRVRRGLYVADLDAGGGGGGGGSGGGGGGGGGGDVGSVGSVRLDGLRDRLQTLHAWLQRTINDSPAPDDTRGVIEMYLEAERESAASQILLINDDCRR